MHILLNELPRDIAPGTTLGALRDAVRPGADVLIVNGAPAGDPGQVLAEGDAVVLIRRGETPARDELEALMAARHTPGVHARLRRATVGIAGLGGLGSAVAVALARVGVGRLVLADFDVVEPSNLNRQQYFVDQIGLTKCEALAANLARINPYVRVETHAVRLTPENVPTIFAGVDVLVEAFDTAEGKAMLVESFMAAQPGGQARSGVPIVVATGLAGHGPSNTIVTRRAGGPRSRLIVVGDGVSAARPGTGLMAPRVGVAAHHQANAVLRILLGEDPVGDE
jgi:sulfur carrier protein ThiS adenylyltransferase